MIASYLIQLLRPQSEFAGRGRERRVGAWGSAFIAVECRGLVFCRLTLLVNLKLKSENLKCRKTEKKSVQMVNY